MFALVFRLCCTCPKCKTLTKGLMDMISNFPLAFIELSDIHQQITQMHEDFSFIELTVRASQPKW